MKNKLIIKKIIRDRTIEATKKGIYGKLVCVAKNYGSPIMGHHFDAPFLEQDWVDFNDPTKDWSQVEEDENGVVPRLGFVYDSLKMGVNFEIVLKVREFYNPQTGSSEMDKPSEVKCSYNGYTVYHENEGKLVCYAPFPEWEKHLDKIYNQATGKDKIRHNHEMEMVKKIREKSSNAALGMLRRLWGI